MPSEKSQSQKVTLNIFLNLQNYGNKKKISGCQGLGVVVEGHWCDN